MELRLQGPDVLSPTNRLRKELKIFLLTHLLWNAGDRSDHLQANYNESWMHCYTCLGQFVTMSQVHLSHQSGFKAFGSFSASYTHRLLVDRPGIKEVQGLSLSDRNYCTQFQSGQSKKHLMMTTSRGF